MTWKTLRLLVVSEFFSVDVVCKLLNVVLVVNSCELASTELLAVGVIATVVELDGDAEIVDAWRLSSKKDAVLEIALCT